jgi:hypothetical protein
MGPENKFLSPPPPPGVCMKCIPFSERLTKTKQKYIVHFTLQDSNFSPLLLYTGRWPPTM